MAKDIWLGKEYTVPVYWLPKESSALLGFHRMKAKVVYIHPKCRWAVLQYKCGVRECFSLTDLEGGY